MCSSLYCGTICRNPEIVDSSYQSKPTKLGS